jgi:hypothetical protein
LAATPELKINITVALKQAEQQLASAQAMVATSATKMGETVKRGIADKFDTAFGAAGRAARRMGTVTQLATAGAAAAAGDLQGAVAALPGPFGAVGAAGMALGEALHEAFTGAKAEAEKLRQEVEVMEKASGFKAQARDAERLLAIEQEMDPVRKIELERMNELAKIRSKVRQADTEGAAAEAAAAAAAETRLVNAQYDNKIREHNAKLADEARKLDESAAEEAKKIADARAEEEKAREKSMEQGRQMLAVAQMEEKIAKASDETERRALELQKDLYDIEQDRLDNAEEMGEELASQIADAQRGARISREQAELEDELIEKQKELAEMTSQSGAAANVQSVDFGFGGAMLVAQSANQGILVANEKQLVLQGQIAQLVSAIARNTTNLSSMGFQ